MSIVSVYFGFFIILLSLLIFTCSETDLYGNYINFRRHSNKPSVIISCMIFINNPPQLSELSLCTHLCKHPEYLSDLKVRLHSYFSLSIFPSFLFYPYTSFTPNIQFILFFYFLNIPSLLLLLLL